MSDHEINQASRHLLSWLAPKYPLPKPACDAVIGLGHFDLAIPRYCLECVQKGHARQIIFSGGIGAGTADLGQPEADAFLEVLKHEVPEWASRAVVENRSTNTAENFLFTESLLRERYPDLALGAGIRSVLLVATPARQRRVGLTWQKLFPNIPSWNAPVPHDWESLKALYQSKGEDLNQQLLGEYDRIRDYPARGWIAPVPIPPEITQAAEVLRKN